MRRIYTHVFISFFCALLVPFAGFAQSSAWTAAGPVNFPVNDIGQINGIGRVSQMKFDPVNRARVYAVAPHGVFVSNDSTSTWSVLPGTNTLPTSLGCASVCIDNTNNSVLYLGTGDANYYGSGSGIWKSTDGGYSFVQSNTGMGNVLVIEILMSPVDHNTLVAATSNGIYKTTNGGASWTQPLAGGSFSAMQSNSSPGSTTLYAVTGSDASFYLSTDFGNTWTANNIGGTLSQYGGRVAVTPANPNTVYVTYLGNNDASGNGGIVYQSTDGGNTFTQKKGNVPPNLNGYTGTSSGQGGYNYAICADPNNASTVYVVGHLIWKSTDAGVTWTQMEPNWASVIHTDMHGIQFSPWNSAQLFDINDGGVWINTDGTAQTWTPNCQGLVSSEFYHMANSHVDGGTIGGGLQDNGEVYVNSRNSGVWHGNRGGDFTSTYYADNTSNYMYYLGAGNRRDIYNSPAGGAQSLGLPSAFTPGGSDVMAFSNVNSSVAFWSPNPLTASQNASYQTLDGFYFTTNLQANPPAWTWTQFNGNRAFGMAAAYSSDSLFILYNDGSFTRVANASGLGGSRSIVNTGSSFVGTTLGVASFSAGALATTKNGRIYLAANGSVFRSADNGSTWTPVGSGTTTSILLGQKIKRLIADTGHSSIEALYAYTSQAVYYKDLTMADWSYFTTDLPTTASLSDLDIFFDPAYAGNSRLRVSSYGRGTWQTYLANNNPQFPPTLSFTAPANNAGFAAGASISFNVTAASPNAGGSIVKIDFYNGAVLVATATTAPYSYTLANAAAGQYIISARATDNLGVTATVTDTVRVGNCTNPANIPQSNMRVIYFDSQNSGSEAATNVLDGNPSTIWHTQYSPTSVPYPHEIQLSLGGTYLVNTFKYLPRQDGSTNGMVAQYEVYVSMDSSSWGTPVATGTLPGGKNEKLIGFAERTGKYVRFRTLSELNGNPWTSAAELNVAGCLQSANQAPAVSIISPVNNAGFATGANIGISANASSLNTGDTISSVNFYQGSTLLGSSTARPYGITWNNVANGAYALTAKAIDQTGLSTISAAINITVATPPGISITSPAANAGFASGSSITISASAVPGGTNRSDSIARVDFYQGGILLGSSPTAPYSFRWTNVGSGNYSLTARATSNGGLVSTSAPVSVVVSTPPTVSITSPANNAAYSAGANITINATAGSPNTGGSIAKVDFYQGSSLLGSSATAPYSFTWTNVPYGGYALTAVATDNNGITTRSASVNVLVGQTCTSPAAIPQSQMQVIYYDSQNSASEAATNVLDGNTTTIWHTQYSPSTVPLPHEIQLSLGGTYLVNTFKYLPRQDASFNGTVGKYEIYVSTDSTNWGTAVATGTFAADKTEKVVTFFEKTGKYLRFRALTEVNGNQWTSAAEMNVSGCVPAASMPPTVSISSPANNASFSAGSNITINATAASPNTGGSISKVDFYQGTTLLGTSTASPYSYTWTSVPAGSYSLTAKATDNGGLVTTSAAINITVSNPACNAPAGLTTASITGLAATVSWTAVTGAANYDVDYQLSAASSWTNAVTANTATSVNITGLTPGSSYNWRVRTNCSTGGSSAYSQAAFSTTAAPPTVSITSPANNAGFTAGANITINATAGSPNTGGSISKVDFYQGTSLLGTSTTPPYSLTWNNVPAGTYTLTAKATDNLNAVTTSAAVSISVTAAVCNTPTGLTSSSISSTAATLSWTAVSGAAGYDLDYQVSGAATWANAVTGTTAVSFNLTGLSAGTSYNWQVRTNCTAGGSSAYAQAAFSTTNATACPDIYEPNGSFATAAVIPLGTTITANIRSAAEADWFTFKLPNSSSTNLRVTLSNLPADYDLYLYNSSNLQIGASTNTGLVNEVITNNAGIRKASYYIKVVSKTGVFDSTRCYSLIAETSSNPWPAIPGLPGMNGDAAWQQLQVYPNPANNSVMLRFSSKRSGSALVKIFAADGRPMMKQVIEVAEGQNGVFLDIGQLPAGLYLVQMENGNNRTISKLTITR